LKNDDDRNEGWKGRKIKINNGGNGDNVRWIQNIKMWWKECLWRWNKNLMKIGQYVKSY